MPCFICGYELRGINPMGDCPECGTFIARSALRREPSFDFGKCAMRPMVIGGMLCGLGSVSLVATYMLENTFWDHTPVMAFGPFVAFICACALTYLSIASLGRLIRDGWPGFWLPLGVNGLMALLMWVAVGASLQS